MTYLSILQHLSHSPLKMKALPSYGRAFMATTQEESGRRGGSK